MSSLPIIDFSPFLSPSSTPEKKRSTALEIDKACREVGFFYISNHGVPSELMEKMLANARDFFERATEEEKAALAIKRGDNARGFVRVTDEVKGSHEAIDFYRPVEDNGPPYDIGMGTNQWPKSPSDFQPICEAYIERMESLGKAVMSAIAMALNVDEDIFLTRIDKSFWNLRILGYEGRKSKASRLAGIGEHTDFGILTFLLSDSQQKSLQVLSKPGEWTYANPIEGCFVCNIGDMLSAWTRGAYQSTLHRVLHNSDSLRISVPFFFDPNWDAYISPVLPAPDGAEDQSIGVRYRDKFVKSVSYPLWRDP